MTRKVTALPFSDAEPGHCRLCGVTILRKDGQPAKNRRWCDSHQIEAKVIGQPIRARAAVFRRDRGICGKCGTDCTSYEAPPDEPGYMGDLVQINRKKALEWCEKALSPKLSARVAIWPIDLGDWHADHEMPLHLVDRDKPDAWQYWTLDNLRTLCPSCHEQKTSQEAKDRGKVRRLNGTTKKRKGPKIPQRANPWPPKGARKMITPEDKPAHAGWIRPDGYWRPNGIPDDGPPSPRIGVVTNEQLAILKPPKRKLQSRNKLRKAT